MARKRATVQLSGYTILVVDDQEETLISVRLLLEREGHHVLTAASGEEALALFRRQPVHLVIVDYFMPRMSGEAVIQEIRKLDEEVQILLQTGYSGEKPPREMLRALAIQGYHDKAEGPEKLLLWVDVALKATSQLKKVQELEQMKEQLLANVSHELRTPLHIIIGYSDLLLDDPTESFSKDTRQAIRSIRRQARLLGGLVENFLNFVQLQAGASVVTLQKVHLSKFREELEEMMRFLLGRKPVAFVWQVSPQLLPVWADPPKLLLILRNLLSNAAKFTEAGEVGVSAAFTGDGKEVTITVRDTGVGIAPEHHQVIFELFRQVDGSCTSRFGGIGIGLALAHKLARMMNGEITVDSTLGAGASFTLRLQAAPHVAPHPLVPSLVSS
jgi:signal transduction histidine kinase